MCDLEFDLQLRIQLKWKHPNGVKMGNNSFFAFLCFSVVSCGNTQNCMCTNLYYLHWVLFSCVFS
jgi:hypothetical protein